MRAPARPPASPPAANSRLMTASVCSSSACVTMAVVDVMSMASMEVGAARIIPMPTTATRSGTNTTPPPIPKNEDIMPAIKLAEAESTMTRRALDMPPPSLERRKMYAAEAASTAANSIPNIPESASASTMAPSMVPGVASAPSLIAMG